MHPTVANEAELLALLPARCHSLVTSQLATPAAGGVPDVGKMEELLVIARTRCQLTKESSKARKQAERFDTAAWWEYGQVLDRIRAWHAVPPLPQPVAANAVAMRLIATRLMMA